MSGGAVKRNLTSSSIYVTGSSVAELVDNVRAFNQQLSAAPPEEWSGLAKKYGSIFAHAMTSSDPVTAQSLAKSLDKLIAKLPPGQRLAVAEHFSRLPELAPMHRGLSVAADAARSELTAQGPLATSVGATKDSRLVGSAEQRPSARLARELVSLTTGWTRGAAEIAIKDRFCAYVNEGKTPEEKRSRTQELLKDLGAAGVSYGRLVDEIEDPKARAAFLDATLPFTTSEQKADAIASLSGDWFWRLLELFFGFFGDRQAVSQIVASGFDPRENGFGPNTTRHTQELVTALSKRGVDVETLYEHLPQDTRVREQFIQTVGPALSLEQRAAAIGMFVRGYTPADKERAIASLIANTPVAERADLMARLKKFEGVSYYDVFNELDGAERKMFASAVLSPEAEKRLRDLGLPVTQGEFTAMSARELTKPTLGIVDRIDGPRDSLNVAVSAEKAAVLAHNGDGYPAKVDARGKVLDEILTTYGKLGPELAKATASQQAELTRLEGEIARLVQKRDAALRLSKNPGSGSDAKLLADDALRAARFLDAQIGELEGAKSLLATVQSDATVAARLAAGPLSQGAVLLATTQLRLLDFRDRFGPNPQADKLDGMVLAPYFDELDKHLVQVATYKVELMQLEQSDPALYKQVQAAGLLTLIDADIAALKAQKALVLEAFTAIEGSKRLKAELEAQLPAEAGRKQVHRAEELLTKGTDAELDKFGPSYDAKIAAVDKALGRLVADRNAAQKVVARLGKKAELSSEEMFTLARARLVLSGVSKDDSGKFISLEDQIFALAKTKEVLEQSRSQVVDRREHLRLALSARLHSMGLPGVVGTDDKSLQAGLDSLALALGLPAPKLPPSGGPYATTADAISKFNQQALERQVAIFSMSVQMLRTEFGIEVPGVVWEKQGTALVPMPPMSGSPPTLDFAKLDEQMLATHKALAGAVGLAGLEADSLRALSNMTTMKKGDSIDQAGASAFFDAYKKTLETRAFMSASQLSDIKQALGKVPTLGKLMALASDPTQPMPVREGARALLNNPELRTAINLPPASSNPDPMSTGIDITQLDELYARAKAIDVEGCVGKLPLQFFYSNAAEDAREFKRILEGDGSEYEKLKKMHDLMGHLSRDKRQGLLLEFGTQFGPETLGKKLQSAFNGQELGWAMAVLERSLPSDWAKNIEMHLTWEEAGTRNWPDRDIFPAHLRGKPMLTADVEDWTFGLKMNTARDVMDLYDNKFDKVLYDMHDVQPPSAMRKDYRDTIANAQAKWKEYQAVRATDPTKAAALKKEVADLLAHADDVETFMREGSLKAADRAMEVWSTVSQVSKAVAITAAATAVTIATLGAAAPEGIGVAGASWAAVGGSVLAGTAAGTTLAFTMSVAEQAITKGGFSEIDWNAVGRDTRDGAGMAFTAALSAGVSVASMAKLANAALTVPRVAVVMNNPLLRTTAMAGVNVGTTAVGSMADIGLHYATGDKKGAAARWEELPWSLARAGVGAFLLAPIAGRFTGATGRVVDGATGFGEQVAVNWLRGKENIFEGAAEAAVNNMVVSHIFETFQNNQALRTMRSKNAKLEDLTIRLPGEKATVEPSWKITKVDPDSGYLSVTNGKQTKKLPALKVLEANPVLGHATTDPTGSKTPVNTEPNGQGVKINTPPVGFESPVVPGMGNVRDAKRSVYQAIEQSVASGGEVSLASVEAHRFKEWGNVKGDHAVGNAYIQAMAKQLEAHLRASGFPDAVVFHKGGKSFKVLYSGSDHVGFQKAMAAIVEPGPVATGFKKAVYEDVKSNVPKASHKKLKPFEDINFNVGIAKDTPDGTVRPLADRAQSLLDRSFEAAKVAQLGDAATFDAAKGQKRDGFAVYDPAQVAQVKSKGPGFLNELTDFGTRYKPTDHLGAPWSQPLAVQKEVFLGERTNSGRIVIEGKALGDHFTRQMLAGVQSGELKTPIEFIIAEGGAGGGDELRVVRIEGEGPSMAMRIYAIDINDFGVANGLVRHDADGQPIPGPRSADEIRAKVIDAIDQALVQKNKDMKTSPSVDVQFTEYLGAATDKLYRDLGEGQWSITGKVSPESVTGFKKGLRHAGSFAKGSTGEITLGGVSYKASVTSESAGKGKLRLERIGEGTPKVLEDVAFTAVPDGKAFKLSLDIPDVRTTITAAGVVVYGRDLETVMVNGQPVVRLKEDIVGKGFYKSNPSGGDLDHFLMVVADRRAELLKSGGKSYAITSGKNSYDPARFSMEVSLRDLATNPATRKQFQALAKEHYRRAGDRAELPAQVAALADRHLQDLQIETFMSGLADKMPMGVRSAIPGEVGKLAEVPVLKSKQDIEVSAKSIAGEDWEGSSAHVVSAKIGDQEVAVKIYRKSPDEAGGEPVLDKRDYDRFMTEVRGSKLLSELGIGPKFYGVVDLGDGRLAFAMEKLNGNFPERMSTTISEHSVNTLRDAIVKIQAAGVDVMDFQYFVQPDGTVRIMDVGGMIPAKPGERPHINLSQEMMKIRMSSYGEAIGNAFNQKPKYLLSQIELALNPQPGKRSTLSGLSRPELESLKRVLRTMDAETARATFIRDPSGKLRVIDLTSHADGAWQWNVHTLDASGQKVTTTESFDALGYRTGFSHGEIKVPLVDVRNVLPAKVPLTGADAALATSIKLTEVDGRIDTALASGLDPALLHAASMEREGKYVQRPDGGQWDYTRELLQARRELSAQVKWLDETLGGTSLTNDQRHTANAMRTRALAGLEVINATLEGRVVGSAALGTVKPAGPDDGTRPQAPIMKGPSIGVDEGTQPQFPHQPGKAIPADASAVDKADFVLSEVAPPAEMKDYYWVDNPATARKGLADYFTNEKTPLAALPTDEVRGPKFSEQFLAAFQGDKLPDLLPPGGKVEHQGGGVSSDIGRFVDADGKVKFFKAFNDKNGTKPLHEVASYELSAMMGLDFIAPIKIGKVGGKVGAVIDAVPPPTRQMTPYDFETVTGPKFQDSLSDLRAYDFLTGASDRHARGNVWMNDATGKLMVIDHEANFIGEVVPYRQRMRPISGGFNPESYTPRYIEAFKKLSPESLRKQFAGKLTNEQVEVIVARYYMQRADIMAKHPGALP